MSKQEDICIGVEPEPDNLDPEKQLDIDEDNMSMDHVHDEKKPVLKPNELYPADKGWRPWLCVAGAFCGTFSTYGFVNCMGVFEEYYLSHQLSTYTPSAISWISSIETFIIIFLSIFIGPVYDVIGPRPLVYPGTAIMVLGIMMTSLCTEYYQFILAQAVCTGVGASLLFNPCISTVSTWFHKKRATALGITTAGASSGGVIIPIIFRNIEAAAGFAWAIRAIAFIILGLSLFACFAVTSRIKPPGYTKINVVKTYGTPFKDITYSLTGLAIFIVFLGAYVPNNYIPAYAVSHGFSSSLASYLSSMQNAASTIGRILPGVAADKLGRFNMFVLSAFVTGALILALWIPATGHVPIILFAVLYGFFAGPVMSVWQSMVAEISPIEEMGARLGAISCISSFSCLIGIPVAGAILDANDGKYWGMAVFTAVCMLVGGAIAQLARLYYTDWVWIIRK